MFLPTNVKILSNSSDTQVSIPGFKIKIGKYVVTLHRNLLNICRTGDTIVGYCLHTWKECCPASYQSLCVNRTEEDLVPSFL